MASDDPLKTVHFALAVPTIPKVEDTIALELLCDDEVIGSQRIVVPTSGLSVALVTGLMLHVRNRITTVRTGTVS